MGGSHWTIIALHTGYLREVQAGHGWNTFDHEFAQLGLT